MNSEWVLITWSTTLHVMDQKKQNRAMCGLRADSSGAIPKREGLKYRKCRNCQRMLEIERIIKEK